MSGSGDWHETAESLILEAKDEVSDLLIGYFAETGDRATSFTGRLFKQFIARSDPGEFTPWDLAAVGALSIKVDPEVSALLLLDASFGDTCRRLLAEAPGPEVELLKASLADLTDASPLGELYALLRNVPYIGSTTASKLLAAKRPALVPIRDEVVSKLVGAGEAWWEPYQQLAQRPDVRDLVERVELPIEVTLVRRIDVVLWRLGKRHAALEKAQSS